MSDQSPSAEGPAIAGAMEDALAALFIGNDVFSEIENALDVFCPFEAIGMVRQEIRHAHFLEYVINPQRPHGFGSEALRALMDAVTRAVREQGGALSPLDVHLMGLDSAEVRREWRSIDLLVVVPEAELVMAIELKIDAGEGADVGGAWVLADKWRQLANRSLVKLKEDDQRTVDEVVGLVREGLTKFLEQHLPIYHRAIIAMGRSASD